MQTFLPFPDFDESVRCLDWRRLGKQRVEARQIWSIVSGEYENKNGYPSKWRNHPAVKMWNGYFESLACYYNHCVKEWERRGYNNSMKFLPENCGPDPIWLGCPSFHSSHRQTLLFKKPEWYSQFGWDEQPQYLYVWPIDKSGLSSDVQKWVMQSPASENSVSRMNQFWEKRYETL